MRLALGTVQFGLPYGIANHTGKISRSTAKTMLQLAASKGIELIDTAITYGDSEKCLGRLGVNNFRLVTKLPPTPNHCSDVGSWVRAEVESSIERLGVDSLYGLLLHRSDQLIGPCNEVLFQTLKDLKEAGRTKKIGISIYSPKELELLVPKYQLDLIQAPFNLVDHRLHTTGWLKRLKSDGVEIHTRSAFLQGLLLMPRRTIPKKFAPWSDLWDKWHEWLSCHSMSAVHACLAFPLSFPEIDHVIIGADNVEQLEQIIGAAESNLPDDLPDLHCDEESLINPAHWVEL